ncbi:putative uncharacterized protein DDB_G0277255 isoform X2 [Calliphora vicina]|uniref:putative uncharacterized protein DDB_G0277255 isoform X2 n=1 Tax=Calliphora vicina TaxID=7373 RepID=UPI00325A79F8
MIFFLINRFRRKKLRARESRQTAEDQRSIVGSIGYIAGNMGYMEGNLSSMDYTYGGAATHYPLWKPPSGYFPRGEAPPPYDEAVAISQAEALSAQCAAAAAAAQVAANQRATMNMNSVEMQNADLNRRAQASQQMQQIQHHAQPQTAHTQLNHQQPSHVVPTLQTHVLAPQSQQSNQSHQITQSTTNLINININSGGNITTIATGENHQPPYSLQDENGTNTGLIQQQSSALATQQMQMQQQQQQLIAATTNGSNGQGNGRVHIAQSNSICVQTMTPINQQPQQQQPQQQQQMPATQNGMQSAQMMTANINGNNSNTLSRQTQNLVMNTNNDCGYKNCHLSSNNSTNTVSRRLQRTNEPLQQYVVDVEVNVGNGNNRGYHSLPPCNNTSPAECEVIASPTQFSNNSPSIANAISTPAIDQVTTNSENQTMEANNTITNTENCALLNNSGHNTLPLQHNQSNKSTSSVGGAMKNSSSSSSTSSSKRYHRTMPRYYAVADPLSSRDTVPTNALNTASKSSKAEVKLTSNNITNSSNNSSANSSLSSKKPTCQCPVQHVPMSYMGTTQLSNAQNVSNNAFFTVLSNKLSSSTNNSPTSSQQQHASQRLQTNSNTNSLNYQQRPKSSQSLSHTTRDGENMNISSNNTMKRSLNSHCNYESKIATISTGELQNSGSNAQSQHHQQQQLQQQQQQQHHHHSHSHAHHHGHHSTLLPPPQHHDDSSPIVLGRVTKRSSSSSSGDRLRSASSGSTRSSVAESVGITSPAAAAYLNSKVDAYLNFAHGTNHHLKANDLINPALPPKLHKSLTNLKSTTTTASAATNTTNNHRKNHNNNENAVNINNSNTTSTNCNNFSSSLSPLSSSSNAATANTTSVQTIYTLSKPHHSSLSPANTTTTTTIIGLSPSNHAAANLLHARKSEHDHIMKITQQQPPSLTLPLSTTSTISSFTSSNSKINTSTFYPLQNNVTYTLPKNIGGKMSLNSTINSVVSKVPSVISLPSSTGGNDNMNSNNNSNYNNGGGGENHSYHSSLHHHALNEAAAISKSTTLPKILRTKRDLHNTNISHHNSSANNPNSSINNSSSPSTTNNSANYAVSQCSMPAYPKQYNTSSAAAATTSSSSTQQQQNQTSHSHHGTSNPQSQQQQQQPPQQQHQPTNINMQTQTITSTLAANYCPEDSHLNPHYVTHTNTNATTPHHSNSTNSKQLPVCTTSKNCLNPKEHFLPNDTSLDDDYLSECENCKIAQSSKYYLDAEALASGPQETMTLQRKSMEECKEEPETGYYRISHTLPTNSKKNASYFS